MMESPGRGPRQRRAPFRVLLHHSRTHAASCSRSRGTDPQSKLVQDAAVHTAAQGWQLPGSSVQHSDHAHSLTGVRQDSRGGMVWRDVGRGVVMG